MGGTKIIVFQLKELIRTAIFALIGLLLIIALVFFFMPKGSKDEAIEQSLYVPGTYSTQILLHNDTPIQISVTVNDTSIVDISLTTLAETQEVFYPLVQPTMEQLASEILEKQSLEVNVTPENYYTSQVLLGGIEDALSQAQAYH